jgi:hypothetical protein
MLPLLGSYLSTLLIRSEGPVGSKEGLRHAGLRRERWLESNWRTLCSSVGL